MFISYILYIFCLICFFKFLLRHCFKDPVLFNIIKRSSTYYAKLHAMCIFG
uniref:Uncharacterized protein n=1 Tax=Octopus bimaculoides TaxID=37653 RepID=A0A0L8GIQ0_OCTBM